MTPLEVFTNAYIETALWSSAGDDGEPLDSNHDAGDMAPETLAEMQADCAQFFAANAASIRQGRSAFEDENARAGHDFWLTRCGHGVGFWDGDWPEPYATQLDEAARAYSNVDLYVGDDGLIYGI